jgi:hypothetical protein
MYAELINAYVTTRNNVFNISTSTARPIPDALYETNRQILEFAMRYAHQAHMHVIFYTAPVKHVSPSPYVPSDVARTDQAALTMCKKYGITCVNYVDAIPPGLWATYEGTVAAAGGQPDFAHFTGRGHLLLTQDLLRDVGSSLRRWQESGR